MFVLGVGGALLTAFYMFRALSMTFKGKFRGTSEQEHHVHESPATMTIPLVILAILSIIGGFIGIPEVFATNANKFNDFLSPVFAHSTQFMNQQAVPHQTELILIIVSSLLMIIASYWAYQKFTNYAPATAADNGFVKAIKNKFYIDEAYEMLFVKPWHSLGAFLNNVFDKKGIDGIVNGVGKSVNYGSRQLRLLQSGQVGSYLLLMVVGLLILFIIQLFTK